jgi:hypothetical protein
MLLDFFLLIKLAHSSGTRFSFHFEFDDHLRDRSKESNEKSGSTSLPMNVALSIIHASIIIGLCKAAFSIINKSPDIK